MDIQNLFCDKKIMNLSNSTVMNGSISSSDDIMKLLMAQIFSNPFFSGGALLSIVGFFWYLVNWAWSFGKHLFHQRYFTYLELRNDNITYKWVVDHINQNSKWETRNLSVETTLNKNENGAARLTHKMIPGIGSHYFYYKNKIIYFQRNRETQTTTTYDPRMIPTQKRDESIMLMTYGGSPEFWNQFLDEASAECLAALDKGLSIYTYQSSMRWEQSGSLKKKRPLETVILDNGISEKICADIENFISSAEWYHSRGIPYRRGYLLYGPPGTGKSSFIAALASHFGYGISTLSLTSHYLSDCQLQTLINNAPAKTFILLEDIDVAFKKRESDEQQRFSPRSITLSGLLNALDGIASAEKRILFMTTNFKENLDAALIRPGRADCQVFLGHCTPSMIKKMFQRFYENVTNELAEEFCEAASKLEKTFSPAQLQKHLIVYKDSPKAAIENVQELQ